VLEVGLTMGGDSSRLALLAQRASRTPGTLSVFVDPKVRHPVTRTPMTLLAVLMEEGFKHAGRNVEPRPAVAQSMYANSNKYTRSLRARLARIMSGQDNIASSMGRLGDMIVRDIQLSIETWSQPPNAESWAERKGENNPLIWTRTYVNSWLSKWIPGPVETSLANAAKGLRKLDRDWAWNLKHTPRS